MSAMLDDCLVEDACNVKQSPNKNNEDKMKIFFEIMTYAILLVTTLITYAKSIIKLIIV
ncbi:hypothetical protein [Candidatus Bandiella euplotis]|uniref:hypothetical protein n=1 Tax=Candidatus Bandiella euplotis TaxID=1664265 RepID=UPI002B25E433|nr:hypothetical protein [Candidatus Bandiella woodruffii]